MSHGSASARQSSQRKTNTVVCPHTKLPWAVSPSLKSTSLFDGYSPHCCLVVIMQLSDLPTWKYVRCFPGGLVKEFDAIAGIYINKTFKPVYANLDDPETRNLTSILCNIVSSCLFAPKSIAVAPVCALFWTVCKNKSTFNGRRLAVQIRAGTSNWPLRWTFQESCLYFVLLA